MTHVPTWAELRLDVNKLAKMQKECYDSVHNLLDYAVPIFDKKLSILVNRKEVEVQQNRDSIEVLEHLEPLPMPLSEYFKANRPELLSRANSRVMYLKKKSERRKYLASAKTITYTLDNRNRTTPQKQQQPPPKNYAAFEYLVKNSFSEQEMKRLTAKTYKRLPEVKRRQKEEDTNRMRVQNYKNRMEYGRKLLENRKHGIINYPLNPAPVYPLKKMMNCWKSPMHPESDSVSLEPIRDYYDR